MIDSLEPQADFVRNAPLERVFGRFGRFAVRWPGAVGAKALPAALALSMAIAAIGDAAAAKGPPRGERHWSGVVTWVSDGDTLWIAPSRGVGRIKVRLDGIDAPELCQPGGLAARNALRARSINRRVQVATRRLDDYGRQLARVRVGSEDLGAWLVTQGHAWSYGFRRNPGPYFREERVARRAARGVFADAAARNPREFRKVHGPCH